MIIIIEPFFGMRSDLYHSNTQVSLSTIGRCLIKNGNR
jgi:hypothetical protein